jgi:hypothetical protein
MIRPAILLSRSEDEQHSQLTVDHTILLAKGQSVDRGATGGLAENLVRKAQRFAETSQLPSRDLPTILY